MSAAAPPPAPRAAPLAALAVLVVLFVTVDTRSYGLIPDGKEMLSTAAAVSRFFEIGVSRDFVNAPRRPAGDAVSRYGMGLSLAEAVPATVTRVLRAAAPSVPSAPVFVLAADRMPRRRRLGDGALHNSSRRDAPAGPRSRERVSSSRRRSGATRQATTGSRFRRCASRLPFSPSSSCAKLRPRGAGRSSSESPRASRFSRRPCSSLAVAPLLACALFWREEREERDFLEGKRAGEGVALGQKAATGADGARERAARIRARRVRKGRCPRRPPWPLLLSFSGILLLWSLFESSRFGRLVGGYAGETFSYPFFTGLLRLTMLPNKGLFWYAPIVLLAPFGFFALRRRDARLALACAASAMALLLAACAWWAWDGQAGWGPRLLLPALPPLLVFAGLALSGSARPVRIAGALALVLGAGVNLLGALVPFPAVYALSSVVPPQPISEARAAGTQYEIERGADGVLRATAPHHLSLTPSWSPIRVHALLLAAKLRGGVAETLAREGLPRLDPPFRPVLPKEPAPAMLLALGPVRVGWGREYFFEGEERSSDPWDDAVRDQTIRAIDMKSYARARALGEEMLEKTDGIRILRMTLASSRWSPSRYASAAAPTRRCRDERVGSRGRPLLPFQEISLLFLLLPLPRPPATPGSSSSARWPRPPATSRACPRLSAEGFARGLDLARRQGWPLTAWARAARTGRP